MFKRTIPTLTTLFLSLTASSCNRGDQALTPEGIAEDFCMKQAVCYGIPAGGREMYLEICEMLTLEFINVAIGDEAEDCADAWLDWYACHLDSFSCTEGSDPNACTTERELADARCEGT